MVVFEGLKRNSNLELIDFTKDLKSKNLLTDKNNFTGELYDLLASYNPGFCVAGVTIGISGLMLFAVPPVQRWVKSKQLQSRDI